MQNVTARKDREPFVGRGARAAARAPQRRRHRRRPRQEEVKEERVRGKFTTIIIRLYFCNKNDHKFLEKMQVPNYLPTFRIAYGLSKYTTDCI